MEDQPQISLDPARRCMLLERVVETFNDIPISNPVQRVMLVGKGVQTASQSNEAVKDLLISTRFLEALHAEAKFRSSGVVSYPPALSGEVSFNREQQRV
jgi:hypothetical protein